MTAKIRILVAAFSIVCAESALFKNNQSSVSIGSGAGSNSEMEEVFARTDSDHQESMKQIMASLTVPKAMQVLQDSKLMNASTVMHMKTLMGDKQHLRRKKQPAGYSGLDGARQMLNDMIFEALLKYDEEIAKCTDYYSKQCALMEVARGEISAANFIAANSRMLILDAQYNINKCEESIPKTKWELQQHNIKCSRELEKMNSRLKIVMGDIEVMTMILKMTDCETALIHIKEMTLLHCKDPCTGKSFVSFNHQQLQEQVSKLQSSVSKSMMNAAFADLYKGITSLESLEDQGEEEALFLQADPTTTPAPGYSINKTEFNNPPVPKTKVPGNPCIDPYKGAPSPEDKRAAKCTIKKSPQCYKLQERFLLIQAGIADERDQLMEDISKLKEDCEATRETLQTAIEDDESLLDASQTKLAFATEKEASAGEKARIVAKQNAEYNEDLIKQMKKCSANYIEFETQLCALKKIRGELYKMKGDGHTGYFQDCEVSKWAPEECTKICAGGEQKLSRNVLTHPNGGAACLPLAAMRSCNDAPCPVDCKQDQWSGWSKCSADCGGGVQQRVRDVKIAMRYNGKPCGKQKETKACNIAACEKDCELTDWTAWSTCSKDCDGGTNKRVKFVKEPAEGSGKCPGAWDTERLQYKPCAQKRCRVEKNDALKCRRKNMDVILMIDMCPKTGKDGWEAQMTAATTFIGTFDPESSNMAVITYCGPRTWSGVSQCTGKSTAKIDTEAVCKIKILSHFTDDIDKVKRLLAGLDMMQGMKLLSLAFLAAKSELALGRKDATSVVVGFIDGPPLSQRKTALAARVLRKATRLLLIPTTKFSPLKPLKTYVTRRWQENLVVVDGSEELASPMTITHVIANICPREDQKMVFSREKTRSRDSRD